MSRLRQRDKTYNLGGVVQRRIQSGRADSSYLQNISELQADLRGERSITVVHLGDDTRCVAAKALLSLTALGRDRGALMGVDYSTSST